MEHNAVVPRVEGAETEDPRPFQRKLTLADCIGYALIALLIVIGLLGIDGGMSR